MKGKAGLVFTTCYLELVLEPIFLRPATNEAAEVLPQS